MSLKTDTVSDTRNYLLIHTNHMNSNSKLLSYIHHLMQNDDDLRRFIVDPVQQAENHGLSKAERAVLRRTVSSLSNNSLNGYSMSRQLSSYRRSLRLLQNVIHNAGAGMVQDHLASQVDPNEDIIVFPFTLIINYPNIPPQYVGGTWDVTGMTNEQIGTSVITPGTTNGTYANGIHVTVNLLTETPSIQQVMDAAHIQYTTSTDGKFLTGLNVSGTNIFADLTQYSFSDDYVFWFWTIGGNPNPNSSGQKNYEFASFTEVPGDGDKILLNYQAGRTTAHWQLIAPDTSYGFGPCPPHPQNKTAIKRQQAAQTSADAED